jgi:2-oxoglutarate/2-oxoacid ferredoxin oxidoreductase subunit alpha
VDSDEHDEEAHITEDAEVRKKMAEKRLKKLESIEKEVLAPELIGPKDYKNLIIGWGSTCGPIKEALENIKDNNTAFLHFKQVWPIHKDTAGYLKKAKILAVVEGNATGQFAKLLKINSGINIENKITKYDGSQFSVEELQARFKKLLVK